MEEIYEESQESDQTGNTSSASLFKFNKRQSGNGTSQSKKNHKNRNMPM